MELRRPIFSFFRKRRQQKKKAEEEGETSFLVNGGLLLEKMIVSFNGSHKIPIRSFRTRELIRATNNFSEEAGVRRKGAMFRGSFEECPIIVRKFSDSYLSPAHAIHDIVITSQMSHHKNVLKLLGCCLEWNIPGIVYEDAWPESLSCFLYGDRSLSWTTRLRIANDLAGAILYLHSAHRTPIIFRDLKPDNIIIDQYGVAKLFDFSYSILLPPGELQVKDIVVGTWGYLDPEYIDSGVVTQKCDVYSFGVLLLILLTAKKVTELMQRWEPSKQCMNGCSDKFDVNEIVDPNILAEMGGIKQEKQLQAFLMLALKCIQKGEDRPEMIDVAKELRKIQRFSYPI